MKRNLKSDLTAIALAALLAMTPPVSARPIYDPTDPPDPTSPQSGHGVRIADSSPSYSVFDNTQTSVTINTPGTQTAGWFTDFFTGARDLGDWFCGYCSVDTAAAASSWTSFITSVVNPTLGSGPNGRWKLGDKIAVCDGSGTCVILTFHGYTTDAWFPDPRQGPVTKKDKGKYKNKTNTPPSAGPTPNNGATPFFGSSGQVIFWLVSSEPTTGEERLLSRLAPWSRYLQTLRCPSQASMAPLIRATSAETVRVDSLASTLEVGVGEVEETLAVAAAFTLTRYSPMVVEPAIFGLATS